MPTAYVKQQAKEKGVSTARSERQWDKAKRDAKGGDWALVTHIYKNRMKHLDKRAELYLYELAKAFVKYASPCEEELKAAAERGEIVDLDQCTPTTPPPKKKIPLKKVQALAALKMLNPTVQELKDPAPIAKNDYNMERAQTNSSKTGDRFNENLVLANSENVNKESEDSLFKAATVAFAKDTAESDKNLTWDSIVSGTGRLDKDQNVMDIGGGDSEWDFGYSNYQPIYGKNSDGDPDRRMHMMGNGSVEPGTSSRNAFIG